MTIPVPIPADTDGFMRRRCPNCRVEFKWHLGPINDEAAAAQPQSIYYCPLCGQSAAVDSWCTPAQLEYAQRVAMPEILRQLEDEIPEIMVTDVPAPPAPMVEPNDMQIIVPPCHTFEPVKVPDGDQGPFHCLLCGDKFAV